MVKSDAEIVDTTELARVIVDELCHFERPDHEADFKDDVEDILDEFIGEDGEIILVGGTVLNEND